MYIDLGDTEKVRVYDYYEVLRNYCDLNSIPYHKSWDLVVEYIIKHPGGAILYDTPYKWLFVMTQKLISGQILFEDFMMSGDISQPVHIDHSQQDSYICLICDSLKANNYNQSDFSEKIIIQ